MELLWSVAAPSQDATGILTPLSSARSDLTNDILIYGYKRVAAVTSASTRQARQLRATRRPQIRSTLYGQRRAAREERSMHSLPSSVHRSKCSMPIRCPASMLPSWLPAVRCSRRENEATRQCDARAVVACAAAPPRRPLAPIPPATLRPRLNRRRQIWHRASLDIRRRRPDRLTSPSGSDRAMNLVLDRA